MAQQRRGSKLAMPVLIINLGIEMIYVLEQRLRAQSIPVEKSRQGAWHTHATLAAPSPNRLPLVPPLTNHSPPTPQPRSAD